MIYVYKRIFNVSLPPNHHTHIYFVQYNNIFIEMKFYMF